MNNIKKSVLISLLITLGLGIILGIIFTILFLIKMMNTKSVAYCIPIPVVLTIGYLLLGQTVNLIFKTIKKR